MTGKVIHEFPEEEGEGESRGMKEGGRPGSLSRSEFSLVHQLIKGRVSNYITTPY